MKGLRLGLTSSALVLLASVQLSGCAPYMQTKLGYEAVSNSDYAHFAIGGERRWSNNITTHCEWIHSSNPSRGEPFNGKGELVRTEFYNCGIKIGGAR